MGAYVFFNPDCVERLAARGITARRSPRAGSTGFVLKDRADPTQPRRAMTHVIAVQSHVTITRGQPPVTGQPAPQALGTAGPMPTGPQTALELIEECGRLRRDNQRLLDEIDRLRATVGRVVPEPRQPSQDLDDTAKRFSLIELDL